MPTNRDQGQQTRWYQLCFVPSNGYSSDDSDTESVILPQTTSTSTIVTWQENFPQQPPSPPPPTNVEPEIDWRFPPPPPPLPRWENLELETDSISLPLPPPPPNPEPETDLQFLPPPPPPYLDAETSWDFLQHFEIESEHNTSTDQPDIPDSLIRKICKVKISEMKETHCPICMEDFKVGYKACLLPCNHTFYFECILRWLDNKNTCPVCRFQLDGWEETQGAYLIDNHAVNDNLDTESEIPRPVNFQNPSEYFFQPLPEAEGANSDYESACDELDDIVGASQSGS